MFKPIYKVGDRVKIIKEIGGGTHASDEAEITQAYRSGGTPYYHAKRIGALGKMVGNSLTIYPDQMEPMSREQRIKCLKEHLKELRNETVEIEGEIEFLEKYEDEEDFAAHKIVEIMSATGGPKKKQTAIAEVLRGRKTHQL